jgi:hypothetical protein
LFDNKLVAGNIVMHERFGKGEVLNLEGVEQIKKLKSNLKLVESKNYCYALRNWILLVPSGSLVFNDSLSKPKSDY